MRAYYVPFAAGAVLAVSAFLPWVVHAGVGMGGLPSVSGFWILALGAAAMLLAALSVITRRNSRHPLLLVGLVALGIEFLAWRWMERSVAEHAWASAHASAIVAGGSAGAIGRPAIGAGLYLGLAASVVLVVFGLTIVVKYVSRPYAPSDDDDVG